MRALRAIAGIVLGYIIVAGGLSLIVMTWWINESLPVSPPWTAAIALALVVLGFLAGSTAKLVAGDLRRVSVYAVAALTTLVMVANIVLDVAAEPLWFKLLVLALVVPAILFAGLRGKTSSRDDAIADSAPPSG